MPSQEFTVTTDQDLTFKALHPLTDWTCLPLSAPADLFAGIFFDNVTESIVPIYAV